MGKDKLLGRGGAVGASAPRSLLTYSQDTLQYGLKFVENLVIIESYYLVTSLLQPFCANGVVFFLHGVDVTVYLHNQASLGAVEVHDEAVDGMLAAEVEVVELSAAQVLPQFGFGRCLRLA